MVAVDKHYNNSAYSAMLELSRPDTIAPAPALITSLNIDKGKVIIHMEGSPSSDISSYELLRGTENDTVQQKLAAWKSKLPLNFEEVSPLGKTYVYVLRTIDNAGNHSQYSRKIFIPGSAKKTINLKTVLEKNGKSVVLSWDKEYRFL